MAESPFFIVKGVEVLMEPPPGWDVDFENPHLDKRNINAAIAIFAGEYVLGALFFGQRMYTNAVLLRNFRIDDYLLVIAFTLSTATQILVVYSYANGLFGSHTWEMSLDKYNLFSLLLTVETLLYIMTTIFSKVILCFFYYRLSPATWYRYAVYFTAFICAGSLFGIWWAVLFSCDPIAASWDQRVLAAGATCINRPPMYITQAAFGSATDFMLLVLPIPTLIGLQMNRKKKLGLIGLFSVGSVTLVTSIIRLVLLLPTLTEPDQPWALSEGCVWVIVEANLLMMCASLPTLRIFLSRVFPRLFDDDTTKKSSEGYNGSGSGPFNLVTFGGTGGEAKRKFDTLVELEHDVYGGNDDKLRRDPVVESDTQVYGGRGTRGSDTRELSDQGSEEGIVQTTTTTVSYMKR